MRNMNVTGPTSGSPEWAGDFLGREHLVPGGAKIDAMAFLTLAVVAVAVGVAAAGATVVPLDAGLTGPITQGTRLNFGGGKFAILTAPAAAGATSLTVAPLAVALDGTETATYTPQGPVHIPSGTAIGRTFVERAAGSPFGPAAAADDEIYLTAFDVTDALQVDDVELYRHNSIVKENYLPGFATLDAGVLAEIRARYTTTTGEG